MVPTISATVTVTAPGVRRGWSGRNPGPKERRPVTNTTVTEF